MTTATGTETNAAEDRIGKRVAVAVGLVVGAYLCGELVVTGLVYGIGGFGPDGRLFVGLFGLQGTFAVVAAAFLRRGPGVDHLSVSRPTRSQLRTAALAIAATFALATVHTGLVQWTSLEAAGTVQVGDERRAPVVLAFVGASVLVPPVVEEFLFRGVVQRYVRTVSSTAIGIAVATMLFVPVHGLGILATAPNAAAALGVAGLLAGVSIVFGLSYAKTDNLVVPILVHAGYNALMMGPVVVAVL